ncbi:MAG TPA: hypothetical protein VFA60_05585 [Terriglobales bacterium]|nr:hypothetical protein [Terriglobales bacterium]
MKKLALAVAVCSMSLWVACGGGKSSSSSTTVTITISPTTASVVGGQTVLFTATVTGNSNTAVNWQVNSIAGGNSTVGTISTGGLYTAPNTVPNPATVTITAISQADTTKTATASVTITGPAPPIPTAFVVISPQVATLPAGGQQTFSATENGAPIAVTWGVRCDSATAGACGSITTAGVYTAPLTPPPGGNVRITATANDGSAPTATASVTIQFGNGSLSGRYAFTFSGQKSGAPFMAGGSIVFNGTGGITGGTEDVNNNNNGAANVAITGGSYNVGSNGRGTATIQTAAGTESWQFTLVNNLHGFAARFDAGVANASGVLDRQTPSQFTLASVQGGYAFNIGGQSAGRTVAIAGALVSGGAGGITSGRLDANVANVVTPDSALTGTYTAPDANGRGTLSIVSGLGTLNFAYYIVDTNRLKLVGTDTAQVLAGDVGKQAAGPFSNASFSGGFAFTTSGTAALTPVGQGGIFTLDGGGRVVSGMLDQNSNGNLQSNVPLSGTYAVSDTATGRATLSFTAGSSTLQYVFYPQAGGVLNLVEVDATNVTRGAAIAQGVSTFNGSSLVGEFAGLLTGADLITNRGQSDVIGQFTLNGGSALTGIVDVNNNGSTSTAQNFTASYLVDSATGRGAASFTSNAGTLPNGVLALYIVDFNNVLFLETDSNRVLTGTIQKQF